MSSAVLPYSDTFEARPGHVYLVKERRPELSYALLRDAAESGAETLMVSRELPAQLRTTHGLVHCRILWLTHLVGEDRVEPTAIGTLMREMSHFIENSGRSVLMIDGLEYLISENTFPRMLTFLNSLRDVVLTNESTLILPIDSRVLSEAELALLERNFEVVEPPEPVLPLEKFPRSGQPQPPRTLLELDDGLLKVVRPENPS